MEVLFFLTLLVYTVPHIMVFGAVKEFTMVIFRNSSSDVLNTSGSFEMFRNDHIYVAKLGYVSL